MTRNLCLIDYQIPKTAGLGGLEGMSNLLFQQADSLADFTAIILFSFDTNFTAIQTFANFTAIIKFDNFPSQR